LNKDFKLSLSGDHHHSKVQRLPEKNADVQNTTRE